MSRFGSPRAPLSAASGILRARAAASGVDLAPASPVDLAASVVCADAWMAITGASSLDRPARFGDPALRVVSALLVRAAGRGERPLEVPTLECASSGELLRLADEHASWAHDLLEGRAPHVLACAASDLWAAGESTLFSAYGSLLLVRSGM